MPGSGLFNLGGLSVKPTSAAKRGEKGPRLVSCPKALAPLFTLFWVGDLVVGASGAHGVETPIDRCCRVPVLPKCGTADVGAE